MSTRQEIADARAVADALAGPRWKNWLSQRGDVKFLGRLRDGRHIYDLYAYPEWEEEGVMVIRAMYGNEQHQSHTARLFLASGRMVYWRPGLEAHHKNVLREAKRRVLANRTKGE